MINFYKGFILNYKKGIYTIDKIGKFQSQEKAQAYIDELLAKRKKDLKNNKLSK